MNYVNNKSNVWCRIGEESVVMSVAASAYFGLNETATFILTCLEQPRSFDSLLLDFVSEFDIDSETASQDLRMILNMLHSNGIISCGEALQDGAS
jgi:hypothetical protein